MKNKNEQDESFCVQGTLQPRLERRRTHVRTHTERIKLQQRGGAGYSGNRQTQMRHCTKLRTCTLHKRQCQKRQRKGKKLL